MKLNLSPSQTADIPQSQYPSTTSLNPVQGIGQYDYDVTNMASPFFQQSWKGYYDRGMGRNQKRIHPIVASYLQIMLNEVIGSEKIKLEFPHTDFSPDFKRKINELWLHFQDRDFTSSKNERDGLNLNEILGSALETYLIEGDCFIYKNPEDNTLFVYSGGAVPEFELQRFVKDGNIVLSGIVFDAVSKTKVGYKFIDVFDQPFPFNFAGTDGQGITNVLVPADQIYHVYDSLDPNLVRGVSKLVSIMPYLTFLQQYDNATLIALIKMATFPIVVQAKDEAMAGYSDFAQSLVPDRNKISETEQQQVKLFTNSLPQQFGRGMVLPAGVNILANPFTKVEAPEQKALRYLSMIASGLNIAQYRLLKDYQKANYSSSRYGDNEDKKTFIDQQKVLGKKVVIPIYQDLFLTDKDVVSLLVREGIDIKDSHVRFQLMHPTMKFKSFPPIELGKEDTALINLYKSGVLTWEEVREKIGMHTDKETFDDNYKPPVAEVKDNPEAKTAKK